MATPEKKVKHAIIIRGKKPQGRTPESEPEDDDDTETADESENAGESETPEPEEIDPEPVARVRTVSKPAAKASLKAETGRDFVDVTMIETVAAPTVGPYSVKRELGFTSLLKGKKYRLPRDVALVLADHGKGTFFNEESSVEIAPNSIRR